MKQTELSAGTKPPDNFNNLHKATVEVRAVYNGELPKPGYTWYVWSFKFFKKTTDKKTGKYKVEKQRKIGGLLIEKTFESQHGEHNVKRMIIQNIVNKQTRN